MINLLQRIRATLDSVGITPATKAYYYLITLIQRRIEVIQHPTVMLSKYSLMAEYKYIAEQYETTIPAVERGIRSAIAKASKLYPHHPLYNNATNRTFIFIISQMIADEIEQEN